MFYRKIQRQNITKTFDDRYEGRQSHHKHQSQGKLDNQNLNRTDKIFQTVN